MAITLPKEIEPTRKSVRRRAAVLVIALFTLSTMAAGGLASRWGADWIGLWALFGGLLALALLRPLLRCAPGVPILTYHSVSRDASWLPWAAETSIRPESLDRQLRLLKRLGLRVVDTEQFVRGQSEGRALPEDAVMLHIDDGYLDTMVAAWPILAKHKACATLFVSTDFIAPDQPPRPTMEQSRSPRWDGFLSWRELQILDRSKEIAVECHGTDHGRVPISRRTVGHVTRENWRQEAWMAWAETPGDKHDYYLADSSPIPLGTPIPESAPSLSARRWDGVGQESEADYDRRVEATLVESRTVFERHMGRASHLFCWPQNITNDRARAIAAKVGFIATTGGRGRNAASGDPRVLARLHAGEDYAGFRSGLLDDLAVTAHLRCVQGDLIWAPVIVGIGALRRMSRATEKLGRRLGLAAPALKEIQT